jgi:hypothetical protein
MQRVQKMLTRLGKFYWSPEPPEHYVIPQPDTGIDCGIGTVAHLNYGAFNLTWASEPWNWQTIAGQTVLCTAFAQIKPLTQHKINGVCLADYLTLYQPKGFIHWLNTEKGIPIKLHTDLSRLLERVEV